MPLHGKHDLGKRGPLEHHRPPHGLHHHSAEWISGEVAAVDGLYRQILELKAMGASNDDLHDLIDGEAKHSGTSVSDPGRGSPANPVDPIERARTLFLRSRTVEEGWMASLAEKHVLVVGEFRPHILDR